MQAAFILKVYLHGTIFYAISLRCHLDIVSRLCRILREQRKRLQYDFKHIQGHIQGCEKMIL